MHFDEATMFLLVVLEHFEVKITNIFCNSYCLIEVQKKVNVLYLIKWHSFKFNSYFKNNNYQLCDLFYELTFVG